MTCEEMLKALNAVIDSEQALSLYHEFAGHLEGCNPCQVVVDNLRKTIQLYRAGEHYPMPEAFQNRFRDALKAKWLQKFPHSGISAT